MKIVKKALTFEDVLLVPQYSQVLPKEVSVQSRFSRNISLNIPLVSAAMDTVTEYRTAIMMARLGGIGVIHKNMDIETQVKQVKRVKKSESGVIFDPISVKANTTIKEALLLMSEYHISGVPVVDESGVLAGILTNRDLRFETDFNKNVGEVMTKTGLITAKRAARLMTRRRFSRNTRLRSCQLSMKAACFADSSPSKTSKNAKNTLTQTKTPSAG